MHGVSFSSQIGLCEDRVVFGYRTKGMIVGWENYCNELNNLYCALNVIPVRENKENYIGGESVRHRSDQKCTKHVTGKTTKKGNPFLEERGVNWVYKIKTNLKETGCGN
jgi:hypothetical protein